MTHSPTSADLNNNTSDVLNLSISNKPKPIHNRYPVSKRVSDTNQCSPTLAHPSVHIFDF